MEHLKFLATFSRRMCRLQRKVLGNTVAWQQWCCKPLLGQPMINTASVQKFKLKKCVLQIPPTHAFVLQRYFSDDSKPQKLKLMDFQTIVWPSIIKTIKNWIYTGLIIRPYLDPDFSLTKFVEGARLAAEVVSSRIAGGKLDELDGLLTPDCLAEVKKNLALLNATQRHEIEIKKDDIYFSFPYELGILFDDSKSSTGTPQQRFVEITVVHHVMRGHKEMIERGEPIPINIGVLPEFREKIFILNYRFIRNYTKGVTDQWTLNVVNLFKPSEFME